MKADSIYRSMHSAISHWFPVATQLLSASSSSDVKVIQMQIYMYFKTLLEALIPPRHHCPLRPHGPSVLVLPKLQIQLLAVTLIDNPSLHVPNPNLPVLRVCLDTRLSPFFSELGCRLKDKTGEPRSFQFLLQRIVVAIQRSNTAAILETAATLIDSY